jgi:hypothetical protein
MIYLEKTMPQKIYRLAVIWGNLIFGNLLLGGWASAASVATFYRGGARAAFALAAVTGAFAW